MEQFFKNTIIALAKESKCVSKKVGAIIVRNKRIISMGYNGTISSFINCNDYFDEHNFDEHEHHKWSLKFELHAEQNAIVNAAKNGISIDNCVCYSTLQPCNSCLLLLLQSGIKEIVYIDKYEKSDYSKELIDIINKNNIILRKF